MNKTNLMKNFNLGSLKLMFLLSLSCNNLNAADGVPQEKQNLKEENTIKVFQHETENVNDALLYYILDAKRGISSQKLDLIAADYLKNSNKKDFVFNKSELKNLLDVKFFENNLKHIKAHGEIKELVKNIFQDNATNANLKNIFTTALNETKNVYLHLGTGFTYANIEINGTDKNGTEINNISTIKTNIQNEINKIRKADVATGNALNGIAAILTKSPANYFENDIFKSTSTTITKTAGTLNYMYQTELERNADIKTLEDYLYNIETKIAKKKQNIEMNKKVITEFKKVLETKLADFKKNYIDGDNNSKDLFKDAYNIYYTLLNEIVNNINDNQTIAQKQIININHKLFNTLYNENIADDVIFGNGRNLKTAELNAFKTACDTSLGTAGNHLGSATYDNSTNLLNKNVANADIGLAELNTTATPTTSNDVYNLKNHITSKKTYVDTIITNVAKAYEEAKKAKGFVISTSDVEESIVFSIMNVISNNKNSNMKEDMLSTNLVDFKKIEFATIENFIKIDNFLKELNKITDLSKIFVSISENERNYVFNMMKENVETIKNTLLDNIKKLRNEKSIYYNGVFACLESDKSKFKAVEENIKNIDNAIELTKLELALSKVTFELAGGNDNFSDRTKNADDIDADDLKTLKEEYTNVYNLLESYLSKNNSTINSLIGKTVKGMYDTLEANTTTGKYFTFNVPNTTSNKVIGSGKNYDSLANKLAFWEAEKSKYVLENGVLLLSNQLSESNFLIPKSLLESDLTNIDFKADYEATYTANSNTAINKESPITTVKYFNEKNLKDEIVLQKDIKDGRNFSDKKESEFLKAIEKILNIKDEDLDKQKKDQEAKERKEAEKNTLKTKIINKEKEIEVVNKNIEKHKKEIDENQNRLNQETKEITKKQTQNKIENSKKTLIRDEEKLEKLKTELKDLKEKLNELEGKKQEEKSEEPKKEKEKNEETEEQKKTKLTNELEAAKKELLTLNEKISKATEEEKVKLNEEKTKLEDKIKELKTQLNITDKEEEEEENKEGMSTKAKVGIGTVVLLAIGAIAYAYSANNNETTITSDLVAAA